MENKANEMKKDIILIGGNGQETVISSSLGGNRIKQIERPKLSQGTSESPKRKDLVRDMSIKNGQDKFQF